MVAALASPCWSTSFSSAIRSTIRTRPTANSSRRKSSPSAGPCCATALSQAGEPTPDPQAELLLYRTVNYQADNLVFADIYAAFTVAALGLAAWCSGLLVWNWLRPLPGLSPRDRRRHRYRHIPLFPER